MEKRFLNIGEVSKLTGLNPKTIRYYEEMKVIPKARRSVVPHGMGYRLYAEEDIRRLAFVKQAKLLDLALSEIRQLIATAEEGCCTSLEPIAGLFIERKLGEIDKRIAELDSLRRNLTRLHQQFTESLIKPHKGQKKLVIFPIPCRDATCETSKARASGFPVASRASEERR